MALRPCELELVLGLQLGRQAVAVPAEAALDMLAAHGLVARHDVLHEAGDEMAVMREAVGEGRPVIEHILVRAGAGSVLPLCNRSFERSVFQPIFSGHSFQVEENPDSVPLQDSSFRAFSFYGGLVQGLRQPQNGNLGGFGPIDRRFAGSINAADRQKRPAGLHRQPLAWQIEDISSAARLVSRPTGSRRPRGVSEIFVDHGWASQ